MATRRVVIIGAGIVGSALASQLAAEDGFDVTVIDRSPRGTLNGSTGHAPGFVGLYLGDEVHVDLARRSAEIYDLYPHAFQRVGAIDVAESAAGVEGLEARAEAVRRCGLRVADISIEEAASRAPAIVDPSRFLGATWSELDGAADARALVAALQQHARGGDAQFRLGSAVVAVEPRRGSLVVRTDAGEVVADDVILAGGIWGGDLAKIAGARLPLVPVGHPYVYSAPQTRQMGGPLVRFPEHGVYSRVHGDRIGMGCYAHDVVDASEAVRSEVAELEWQADRFDAVVAAEIALLPEESRFEPRDRLNGVFSMTPDGRPYLGPIAAVPGLWSAQAIWVTHAAGAAEALVGMMRDGAEIAGGSFSPGRFEGIDEAVAREQALSLY